MTDPKQWHEWPVLACDIESTGVDVYGDRIIQLALVEVQPGQRPQSTTYLVDPGVDIPAEAAAVHGLTREHIEANLTHADPGQMLFEAAGRLARWMGQGWPVLLMNAPFDLSMFEVECMRHGVDTLHSRLDGNIRPVVDVMVLDKHADKYRKGGRKLVDLCRVYDVRHTGAHDATADCLAAARIWPKLMAKHADKFQGMTMPALHLSQVKWRRDQQLSFAAYAAKHPGKYQGEFDPGWPVHSKLRETLTAGAAS